MTLLVIGLVLFLGAHSVRIVADGWRARVVAARGEKAWKALHAIASLAGFAALVAGFAQARADSAVLWTPPVWTRHAAGSLALLAFVFLAAAYVPGNGIKARLHHPMVLAVKTWAFAHLLANGRVVDVVLFGAFLAWAIADFASLRRRDRAAGVTRAPGRASMTAVTVVAGLAAGLAFALWVHPWWLGVAPFAR